MITVLLKDGALAVRYLSAEVSVSRAAGRTAYRFECDGQIYTGGIGRFDNGRIAEIFINGSKVGTAAETNAQEAAIVAPLALQHGCPIETIAGAARERGP